MILEITIDGHSIFLWQQLSICSSAVANVFVVVNLASECGTCHDLNGTWVV